ncbi:unnamed protein product (macronuclear) [Paramecium tetraurelia]|uniref:Uncharacterized protein n=1 Tax=Paramecium tetraurelia TaxID=5888 RepID=A0C7F7_PARTE|nr:uncharacterized protein GSPATT00035854001 [Paramecium tetraurelia]CAK66724.1 unnamed protein product [Paramecium tetraurelia]|eukprot:XP_001434121.1 hypothetical protein (macronuclear) [Paramecium tetraurelia strain d4-2]
MMFPEYYEIDISCFEVKSQTSLAQNTSTLDLFELLTIKFLNMLGNSKDYKFFLPTLNKYVSINGTTLNRILGNNKKCVFELKQILKYLIDILIDNNELFILDGKTYNQQVNKLQMNKKNQFEKKEIFIQHLLLVCQQIYLQQEIRSKSVEEQIDILNKELKQLDNNKNLTNNQKQYLQHQYQQQLITKLKDYGKTKSIPHVNQNIDVSNPELALFVLKESLLRDKIQNYQQQVKNIPLDLIQQLDIMAKINLVQKQEIQILIMIKLLMINNYLKAIKFTQYFN